MELKKNEQYINRDIDWLNFNARVLQEAKDKRNPLYERIKFLAIFSSNLEEFFRVRVSKLRQIKKAKKSIRKKLSLRPNKTLKAILKIVNEQQSEFGRIFRDEIKAELAQNNIHILNPSELDKISRIEATDIYKSRITPNIEICTQDEISLEKLDKNNLLIVITFEGEIELKFLVVPTQKIERFISLNSESDEQVYVFLEDIIKFNIKSMFPEKPISGMFNIKISKDAELYLEDDYDGDWIQQIYKSLEKRKVGQPTRLLYEKTMPKVVRKRVRKTLNLGKVDMVRGGNYHNFSDFFNFPEPFNNPEFHFQPLPQLSKNDFDKSNNYFDLIKNKDQVLHFPYQKFDYLEHWLLQASADESVLSIQISLYRIAKDSKLTTALLKALENGKEVIIFVEAKARFDEKNNLNWGFKFQENGAKVYYSFSDIKVHSKILLISRKELDDIKKYAYIGTGNFNAKTSKIYCDHALFTANDKITEDLSQVFRVLKREITLPNLSTLIISPFNSRQKFEELIENEIKNAENGNEAEIILKMNSLEDKKMISHLYRASSKGVKIRIIVRGFCCLIPGIKGISKNIVVTSILDRFLEHDRVFLFHNNGNEKMFMGSADWMPRNLDDRIEVVTPILDNNVFNELKDILKIQLSDNVKARKINEERTNEYITTKQDKSIRSQYEIYNYLKNLG